MQPNRKLAALLAALTLAGALGACGSDGSDGSAGTEQDGTTADQSTAAIAIDGAWARTSPAAATTGAAYMKLTSAKGDVLTGVSVDPSVAKVAELHETVMAGSDMASGSTMGAGHSMSSTTMGSMGSMSSTTMGAMTMRQVAEIELPEGTTVELKPGGYHIMLMELAKPLTKGSTIVVTLQFETAGAVEVQVPVLDSAP